MAEMTLRTNRLATLEVVSPLHIGSGAGPLLADYDFAVERGVAWVMDPAKMLERYDDEELRHGVPEVRLSRRIKPADYASCAAYSLPIPGAVGNEILPCIKDPRLQPYLPGSSLKGALRTVVAWAASSPGGGPPGPTDLGGNPKYAAAGWERRTFGPGPNYDLMRALLVDDTAPVPAEQMEMALVSVYSLRGEELVPKGVGYRFSVEALKPGTRLTCRLGVAEELFSRPSLRMGERRRWIEGLSSLARERASELIAGEKAFFARCRMRPLQQFYERLEQRLAGLGDNQFLLQMSWGSGWAAKTLGNSFSGSDSFGDVRARYRLGLARRSLRAGGSSSVAAWRPSPSAGSR